MKDFGRWFADFELPAPASAEVELPHDVQDTATPGRHKVKCCMCARWVEMLCGLAGFTPAQIAPMFAGSPANVLLPPEFLAVLEKA